jgi:hypothetical protein
MAYGVCLITNKVPRSDTTEPYGEIRSKAYGPEGGAIEGNGADDALLVDQGLENRLKKLVELCILKSPLAKWNDGVLEQGETALKKNYNLDGSDLISESE